ncbi:hypothetical protein Mgra_00005612 [Meloidogyne graminicola]|uniref:Uncharacterized protein n=1 Tax=Meloidogyne graminicola TaxID=189291 RepID=A0A8S9ZNL5_9BILA|nr:hypothetical protein Mgra_00005612 [Meloidogyne graminicola]
MIFIKQRQKLSANDLLNSACRVGRNILSEADLIGLIPNVNLYLVMEFLPGVPNYELLEY